MKRTPLPFKPLLGTLAASVLLMAPALAQDVDPDADSLPLPEIPLEAPAPPVPTAGSTPAPPPPAAPAAKPAPPMTPVGTTPPQQACGESAPAPFQGTSLAAPQTPTAPKVAQNAQPKPPATPPPTPPTTTAAEPKKVTVGDTTIYGDQLENDPATGLYIFTGNAKAVRGTDEIHAEKLIYNPMTAEFTAEGNVVIFQDGREIHSTRATYKFTDSTGEIADVKEKYGPYYIKSHTVKLHEGPLYEALHATFTTCEKEHPHYDFYARQIEIYPGKELIARHLGIDVFGYRVATIPKYRKSLAPNEDDDSNSLYPSFGYSNNTGPYVRKEFTLRREAPLWLNADVQLNTFIEPSGGLLASTGGSGQFRATLYYRDNAENQRSRNLRVSRLPEIGWVWTPGSKAQPGQFLPHQVGSVHYPRGQAAANQWRISAEASAGYFLQHRGDEVVDDGGSKDGARVKFQVQTVKPRLDLGPIRLNDLRLMARETLYDTGDAFTVFGTGIGKHVNIKNLRLSVMRFDQFTNGTTPFLFDDVELSQEWRPRLEYTTPGFSFTYAVRLRGNNGQIYDQMFSVSKLFHCIEPRLTFRTRQSQVFLEIRIPGLSGYSRTRPGQPGTIDGDDLTDGPE